MYKIIDKADGVIIDQHLNYDEMLLYTGDESITIEMEGPEQ